MNVAVAVYIHNNKAFLPTLAQIPADGFLEVDPVIVCDVSQGQLVASFRSMIDQGHKDATSVQLQSVEKKRDVILQATGVNSWTKLVRSGALSYAVYFSDESIRIYRSEPDNKSRWRYIVGSETVLNPEADLELVVQTLLSDISL